VPSTLLRRTQSTVIARRNINSVVPCALLSVASSGMWGLRLTRRLRRLRRLLDLNRLGLIRAGPLRQKLLAEARLATVALHTHLYYGQSRGESHCVLRTHAPGGVVLFECGELFSSEAFITGELLSFPALGSAALGSAAGRGMVEGSAPTWGPLAFPGAPASGCSTFGATG
jgi:hypothetical protein